MIKENRFFLNVRSDEKDFIGLNKGRDGWIGWFGYGGPIFQWNTEFKIGFGYAGTLISFFDFANTKAGTYQAKVIECAKKKKANL